MNDNTHRDITPAGGNLFAELGYAPQEAEQMQADNLYRMMQEHPEIRLDAARLALVRKYHPTGLTGSKRPARETETL